MNQEQIMSIVRSAAKVIGGALIAHGLSKYASIINGEDLLGLISTLVGLALSHSNHSSTPNEKTPTAS